MIFPAIDLMNGGCVRLHKGDFEQRTNYQGDPIKVAQDYARQGAKWLHIVDLDGAKNGAAAQSELIIKIAQQTDINVQTGGGIRSLEQIKRLLEGGVKRVVIGSLAVSNPVMVKFWLSELGPEAIVIALDVNINADGIPFPALRGWTEPAEKSLWQVLEDYAQSGLKTILVTDIDRDGVMRGSNLALYKDIATRFPDLELISSGGIGSLAHVKALKRMNPYGIIIGKALYEGAFSVKDAITC